jgi:hypothetical protein
VDVPQDEAALEDKLSREAFRKLSRDRNECKIAKCQLRATWHPFEQI